MQKLSLILLCLISTINSSYLPMKKKDIGYEDNICLYSYSGIDYVKTCDNGKYCKVINDLGICIDSPSKNILPGQGESCFANNICDINLNCFGNTCTKATSEGAAVCPNNNESPLKRDVGWKCINNNYKDYCEYTDTNGIYNYNNADYFQVCGKIEFDVTTHGNDGITYTTKSIASSYIGSEEDGTFVDNELACKSGFALEHYYTQSGGSLKDPHKTGGNSRKKMCVKVEEIEYRDDQSCVIKYDGDKLYYKTNCDPYYLTKLELFKKYIEVFTVDKQKECAKKDNYNEPKTCNDNEIRKWYYLYSNPADYIEYYDKDLKFNDVLIHKIQQRYPSYQISGFLNINYFICLLFFLLSL